MTTHEYGTVAAPVDLSAFGHDPWWLVIGKALAIFVFLVLTPLVAIYAERKVMARMQMRVGPNRVGPRGMLQSLADGIKLALKEGITPTGADKPIYLLAPVIAVVPAFMAFAVIPFGPQVSIFGTLSPLQLTDLPVGVLYILAVTSIGVYGIVLAGWSSGSTYPLLGALRSTAQVISYEVAMGLSFAAVFLYAGTMSTSGIVSAQQGAWYVFLLLPSFLIYVTAMVGETNRAPFDLPEAEGELVGGFHTEYSSLKFAMFMLAEYVNMVTVSALATTLPGRVARTVPVQPVGRRQFRLVAGAVVCRQGVGLPLRLHLVAQHASSIALRPVHESRLEGSDPRCLGVGDGDRDCSCLPQRGLQHLGRTSLRRTGSRSCAPDRVGRDLPQPTPNRRVGARFGDPAFRCDVGRLPGSTPTWSNAADPKTTGSERATAAADRCFRHIGGLPCLISSDLSRVSE